MPVCLDYSCVVNVPSLRCADPGGPAVATPARHELEPRRQPRQTQKEPDTRRAALDTKERRDAVYTIGVASVRMSGSPRKDAPRLRRSRDQAL
jgi:hypothetical protein